MQLAICVVIYIGDLCMGGWMEGWHAVSHVHEDPEPQRGEAGAQLVALAGTVARIDLRMPRARPQLLVTPRLP